MQRLGLCGVLLGFVNCMAVQVPEDYVSDLYYGDTPKVVSATPSTSMQWTTLTQSIRIQFNNPMAASSFVIDSAGTCSGNLQFYDTNNAGCRAITGVTSEKRDSVFTATITGDLDPNSDYTITVGASIMDFRGRALGANETFAFKSGIPSGSEPQVVNVAQVNGAQIGFQVTFSRQMQSSSMVDLGANNCGSTFLLSQGSNPMTYCNGNQNGGLDLSTDRTAYILPAKLGAISSGTYTLIVKKGILDRFSIPLAADYETAVTIP